MSMLVSFKPDYSSISIFTSSIWVTIIGIFNFDKWARPTVTTASSIRAGVH